MAKKIKNIRGKKRGEKGPTFVPLEAMVPEEDLALSLEEISAATKGLSTQEAIFAQEFVVHFNGARAARNAGYSAKTASQIGNNLLKRPKVREAIGKLLSARSVKLGISAEWVLERLKSLVETCMAQAEYIESTDDERVRKRRFDPTPAIRALELIGRHLVMWTDKVDLRSEDGSMSPGRITGEMDARAAAEKYIELLRGKK